MKSLIWKIANMNIRVVYHDTSYDTIPFYILQLGIDCKKIKMFYRNSEKRWITVGADPIRKQARIVAPYTGPERRAPHTTTLQSPIYRESVLRTLFEAIDSADKKLQGSTRLSIHMDRIKHLADEYREAAQ